MKTLDTETQQSFLVGEHIDMLGGNSPGLHEEKAHKLCIPSHTSHVFIGLFLSYILCNKTNHK